MAFKPLETYLKDHDSDGDGFLTHGELERCLTAALQDIGTSEEDRMTISNGLCDEFCIRAEGSLIGTAMLERLLQAAQARCISQGQKRQACEGPRSSEQFDAVGKENALQAEASSWEAPSRGLDIPIASQEDIPIIDLSELHQHPEKVAVAIRRACVDVGFHFIINHGVPQEILDSSESMVQKFGALSIDAKMKYAMDVGTYPGGTGYLPLHSRKLPKRPKGNVCEAFIVKREHGPRNITLDCMPWPCELGENWRADMENYAAAMETLAKRMLPAYSIALNETSDYLEPAFKSPLWRLRFSRYPATAVYEDGEYGIAPHVDTSFFTLLHRIESQPSLVVWCAISNRWVRVPSKPEALLVNTGEILRQVSNDTFLAARHYVLNESTGSRSSLAFFFNATADFKLDVAPGASGGAPKYPPTSYLDGQGVVQGE